MTDIEIHLNQKLSDEDYHRITEAMTKAYRQGREDAIIEALEPYDAESIEDLVHNVYGKGKRDAIKRMLRSMNNLWKKYEEDPDNVPKPDFMSAVALIAMMEGEKNE